jgi:hypothetical protein
VQHNFTSYKLPNIITNKMFVQRGPGFHVPHCTIGDTENWADVSFSCQNF